MSIGLFFSILTVLCRELFSMHLAKGSLSFSLSELQSDRMTVLPIFTVFVFMITLLLAVRFLIIRLPIFLLALRNLKLIVEITFIMRLTKLLLIVLIRMFRILFLTQSNSHSIKAIRRP